MKGRITGLTVIVLVLFGLVLGQSVFVQIHRASALDASGLNPRVANTTNLYPRGIIYSSNGLVLARSIPTRSRTNPYRRSYPLGRLTSDVVGYDSLIYGTGGIEEQYNQYLVSHALPAQSLSEFLSGTASTSRTRCRSRSTSRSSRSRHGRSRAASARSSPSTRATARCSPCSPTRV